MGCILDLEILHNSPEKADEFTGGGDGGDLGWFLGVDAVEELEETVLSLPGMSDDLGRALKASPVADLGDEGHGSESADTTETGEPLDKRFVRGGEGDLLDLFVQVITAADLVVEEREILGEDGAILWSESAGLQKTLQPFSMNLTPV